MAKAISFAKLDIAVRFEINSIEAKALDALAWYGEDAFVKAFYEKLGKAYMENHEAGLREFLKTIRSVVTPAIERLNQAEKVLTGGYHVVSDSVL